MSKLSPAFPSPGLVLGTGNSQSSPRERWQLCPSAGPLSPSAGLGQPIGSSLHFLQGCSLSERCCWVRMGTLGLLILSPEQMQNAEHPPSHNNPTSSWCYCKVSVLTLHVYLWGGSWLLWGFLVRLQIFKVMLRKENVNCKKLITVPVLVLIKKVKNWH